MEAKEVSQACRSVVNRMIAKTIQTETEDKQKYWRETGKATLQMQNLCDDGNNSFLVDSLGEKEYNSKNLYDFNGRHISR